jgi:histidyl-tRNA synthetase
MEIKVPTLSGSLGGGGRYNELIGMFVGYEIPACGFSLGLERIIVVMTEQSMFPSAVSLPATAVMVAISDTTRRAGIEALRLASELRGCGINADLYPARDAKLGIQYKYGTNRNFRFAVTIGAEERERNEVRIRDLHTRKEICVPREELPEILQRILEGN